MTTEAIALRRLIDSSSSILITTHINPDGDAAGSSLALYHILCKMGKNVLFISPNEIPPSLHFLPGVDEYVPFNQNPDTLAERLQNTDLLFCLDYNTLSRTGDAMAELLRTFAGKKVLIDHHQQPDTDYAISFSDTSYCSTCELLFQVLSEAYPDLKWLTPDVATCLYTGILTDSGSFRFNTVQPRTHRAVATLLEAGAPHTAIHEAIFDQNRPERFRLMAVMLSHMTYLSHSVVYSWITEKEFLQSGADKEDSEGFVNMGLSIRGVKVSALFREEEGKVRISFRSKGEVDVNQYARTYFNGGGHRNAAGGTWYGTIQEAVKRFEETIFEVVPS
ncbi:exopolyphosphatase [Thermaurantimonas aggregans]|uniref:Exopolyphosphatase n=1 Tax=Thermaurantimonas aggregans TaxID=2173829 RepID=A0A401XI10_9FLAO|nr:bifunctional oligoribonuclease/PAP phosphatase NrnA [Thermaurantimonas aggregans]MCX8149183.1 bifunctional oligoribonuclease/PAP phosphatase NrnA [Thermaurantimonas aggregans]GCD76624.1 exopolyphosphatase [Thermaurantimonas aggregans]